MYTVRCTRKLLRHMGAKIAHQDLVPTTALGDWYANLLNVGHLRFVHFVSDRSLLSVIVPFKTIKTVAERHVTALRDLLGALGMDRAIIDAELKEMQIHSIGKTQSRSVLGSMRDLALNAWWVIEMDPQASTLDISYQLSEILCGPIGMAHPREIAEALLVKRHIG
jgi:hypothetical protein